METWGEPAIAELCHGALMDIRDYSPSASPTLDEQRDALQKGLGRAMLWATSGRLDEQSVLAACLRDQRFDIQIEDSRANWLWQIMSILGAQGRFRVPILHALYDFSDVDSAEQLAELGHCYARAGDEEFGRRLWQIVEQTPFPQISWLGQKELIDLHGRTGFLLVARLVGRELGAREWEEWNDGALASFAAERLGEDCMRRLLDESTDEAISRFRDCWKHASHANDRRQRTQSPAAAEASVDQVLRAAESSEKCYWFRGWGRRACNTDLDAVLRHLWTSSEPRVIAKLLKVFSARPLPRFDVRLVAFCEHRDEAVRQKAFQALATMTHPLVREFALSALARPRPAAALFALFMNNYEPGDEQLILDRVDLPSDKDQLHHLLIDVHRLLEKNPKADCRTLGLIGYALNPCQECRWHAAHLLVNRHAAPGWLIQECRYDSNEDCRKLATSGPELQPTGYPRMRYEAGA
jgi:hypothetical protein